MVYKPDIQSVPIATALAWRGDGQFLFEEKLDGRWTEHQDGESLLVGETVKGVFHAFDIVRHNGLDCRLLALRERISLLNEYSYPRPSRGNGGEFLEAILANGGEGVVAKDLSQPYGRGWFKAKRVQVFYCIITSKASDGRQSVAIAHCPPFQDVKNCTFSRREKLEPAGNLALRGEKFDMVRIGSILKVEAFGRHKSGLLREARLDRDNPGSWLVKY